MMIDTEGFEQTSS